MEGIEEKLYLEIILVCESNSCLELYEPDVEATDPMEIWAKRNAGLAMVKGWKIGASNQVLCPSCSRST